MRILQNEWAGKIGQQSQACPLVDKLEHVPYSQCLFLTDKRRVGPVIRRRGNIMVQPVDMA